MLKNLRFVKLPDGTVRLAPRGTSSPARNETLRGLRINIPYGFRELKGDEKIEVGDYVFTFVDDRLTAKIEPVSPVSLNTGIRYALAQYRALRPL